ncbi:MAG: hypothetical protein O3B13_24510 [Planctomycetota bacterium]|nr:hypothetical protein [Planctomycetota bacterium]
MHGRIPDLVQGGKQHLRYIARGEQRAILKEVRRASDARLRDKFPVWTPAIPPGAEISAGGQW